MKLKNWAEFLGALFVWHNSRVKNESGEEAKIYALVPELALKMYLTNVWLMNHYQNKEKDHGASVNTAFP